MSYFIMPAGSRYLAGSHSPLIKKNERAKFADAVALLREASEISDGAEAALESARQEAWAQGYAEGCAAAQNDLNTALRTFIEAVIAVEKLHAANVAEAAYAATVAMIGEMEDSTVAGLIATQVIAKQKERDGISILVSTDNHARLTSSQQDMESLAVVANPDLGPTDCHVITANGRIIADLTIQLAVLRDRWGIEDKDDAISGAADDA